MALISKPNTFSAGGTIVAAEHNDNYDTIYNDYNGNITNANCSATMALVDTKLAQLTTAGKVALSALTATGNYAPTGIWNFSSATLAGASPLVFEGGTADAHETTLTITDPTADRTITVPDADVTLASPISSIEDYGTSTSSSTTKAQSALNIAYGNLTVPTYASTVSVTNLPFTSNTSYIVVDGNSGTNDPRYYIARNSGSQFTVQNQNGGDSGTMFWVAIGT